MVTTRTNLGLEAFSKKWAPATLSLVLAFLTGCLQVPANSPSGLSVSVAPNFASLQTGQTQQFTSTVTDTSNNVVTWSANGGTISSTGLYTAPSVAGTYTVTATSAADSSKSASASVTVSAPLIISTSTLPSGTVGVAYNAQLAAAGGTTPYSWSITAGSLPPGLTLTPSTGQITGTPSTAGNTTVTFRVADSSSPAQSATRGLTISIANSAPPPLVISTSSLPAGTVGQGYGATLAASGGTPAYTWSIAAGSLPPGLTLAPSTGQITGTPSTAGNTTVTFRVADSSSPAQSATLGLTISITNSAPPLVISTSSLPAGTVGQAYSATLAASGGTPAYTWIIAAGSLPPGLTLAATSGQITGTPSTAGNITVTFRVADSGSPAQSATRGLTISITNSAPPLVISTSSLPSGTVGQAYSATLAASGGTPAYTWSVAAGSLPPGLTLAPSTGQITGTPSTAGNTTVTFRVADSGSPAQSATLGLTISITNSAPPLVISTSSLPSGTVGQAYSATLAASGGTPAYTWSTATGSLPPGLTLAATSGQITGTPSTAGNTSVSFRVTDSGSPAQSATQSLTISIANSAPLVISTSSLPSGTVGLAYSATLAASGGTPAYTWSVAAGSLPPGLTLAPSTGQITGTPSTAGNTTVTFRVADSGSPVQSVTRTFTLSMALGITPSSLPSGTVGQAYSTSLSATGGTPPYAWSLVAGNLPPGLTLSTSGTISGTPTSAGSYSLTLQVSDATGQQGSRLLMLSIQSTTYFGTMPPGSTLPSDSFCAANVRYSSWEPRPDNSTANHTTGIAGVPINGASSAISARVDGNFTGTTDEILQWSACKWGFDEDTMRAQAVQESYWHMSQLGDYTSDATLCANIGQSAPCYQSYGILQIKGTVNLGTYPSSQQSTAFNVDWSRAWLRACFEGQFTWLGGSYTAGDLWGCIGTYFSGGWYDSGAQNYINSVKQHLANKDWLKPGF